jgi:hypothetical protein
MRPDDRKRRPGPDPDRLLAKAAGGLLRWARNNPIEATHTALQFTEPYGSISDAFYAGRGLLRGNMGEAALGAGGLLLGGVTAQQLDLFKNVRRPTQQSLDEAARQERRWRGDFTHEVYHGTNASFDAFDNEYVGLGAHVGSFPQANNKLQDNNSSWSMGHRTGSNYVEGDNVMPLYARSGTYLDVIDVGDWNDSASVARWVEGSLSGDDLRRWEEMGLGEIAYSHDDGPATYYTDYKEWLKSSDNHGQLDEIRSFLQGQGYDGIRYMNAVENPYDPMDLLRPEVKTRLDAIDDELAGPIMMVDGKFEFNERAVGAHRDKLRADREAIIQDPDSFLDQHSWIIFDPAHLRSRFAQFKDLESENLLAGVGGLLGAGVAARQSREEYGPQR